MSGCLAPPIRPTSAPRAESFSPSHNARYTSRSLQVQTASGQYFHLSPRVPAPAPIAHEVPPRQQRHRVWHTPLLTLEETVQWNDRYIARTLDLPAKFSPRLEAVPPGGKPPSARAARQPEVSARPRHVAGSVVSTETEGAVGPDAWGALEREASAAFDRMADEQVATMAARSAVEAQAALEADAAAWWEAYVAGKAVATTLRREQEEEAIEEGELAYIQRERARRYTRPAPPER